ncbi:MAG TPA: ABC transporter ATP-binding protein, partial [Thermomicrobiales bacterium]|nr:ABC transporter ATP-binding protein [Thermomicrobiales bacterium]
TVLLFDEPLSALDRNLRDQLKFAILDLQRRTKKTAIYVTHDQSEAFAISDRIFVMNGDRIEQAGSQLDIYLRPATEFVASFVGDNNAFPATVTAITEGESRTATIRIGSQSFQAFAPAGITVGEEVLALARPENVEILGPNDPDSADMMTGTVEQLVFEGPTVRLTAMVDGKPIQLASSGFERLELLNRQGMSIRFRFQDVTLVRQP